MQNNNETQQLPLNKDLHQCVTDTIVGYLQAGIVPWQKPWQDNGLRSFELPRNCTTGNSYQGINILLLLGSSLSNNYQTSEWASFKQWKQKDQSVRKGEKGTMIVYYDTFEKEVEGEIKNIPFLKSSVVFNRCQLQDYKPDEEIKPNETSLVERIDHAENFVQQTKAEIVHEGGSAVYNRRADKIFMPSTNLFYDIETCTATEAYYSTLFHELVHWSGDPKRLDRVKGKKFGDANYATEELVAELGAAFLCAELEITQEVKQAHASYIASWLKALQDDKKLIVTTASEASKAVKYLHGLQLKA